MDGWMSRLWHSLAGHFGAAVEKSESGSFDKALAHLKYLWHPAAFSTRHQTDTVFGWYLVRLGWIFACGANQRTPPTPTILVCIW